MGGESLDQIQGPPGGSATLKRWDGTESFLSSGRLVDSPLLFERFLYGLALVDRDGSVLYLNRKARQVLMPADYSTGASWTCCELICNRLGPIVGSGCMSKRVAQTRSQMPEVRMDIEQERLQAAAWVTASPLDANDPRVLFHLRPGRTGDRRRRTVPEWPGEVGPSRRSKLQIQTLGRFQVEGLSGPVNGGWLEQRAGQLLKYLVCERRRSVASDRIGEALWPEAGVDESRNRLRHYVHALREKLEPERGHRSPARFVIARRGGYVFDTKDVWIDTDEFEREARAGLATFARGLNEAASAHLSAALRVYRGPFLSEDPYAEWALEERERLGELAARALRAQIQIQSGSGQLEAAAENARRLADMEPFDTDAQKTQISICLKRGRRGEAIRRYDFFRRRLLDSFDQKPDFNLAEMERELRGNAGTAGSAPQPS